MRQTMRVRRNLAEMHATSKLLIHLYIEKKNSTCVGDLKVNYVHIIMSLECKTYSLFTHKHSNNHDWNRRESIT